MNLKTIIGILFIGLTLVACSHGQKYEAGPNTAMGKAGIVSVYSTWVKDKGKKFDLDFHIKNDSTKYIIVMLNDITCRRAGEVGKMKYTFFNTGERVIDLAPGQDKGAHMVCLLSTKADGAVEVDIATVHSNPSQDRKTAGEVIATNIVWKLAPLAK